MTPAEAGVLLAGIAVFDNRKPGTEEEAQRTMTLWASALDDVSLADAGQAVTEHFATSSEYLMPAHIRRIVKRIREKRLHDHPPLTPPDFGDEKGAEAKTRAWLKEARSRIGDGEIVDCNNLRGELRTRNLPDLRALMPGESA